MAEILNVKTPDGSYEIVIEPGLLSRPDTLGQFRGKSVIVTNQTVQRLYSDRLSGFPLALMLDGERYKTINTVETLYGDFIEAKLDRSSTVIAFGGGVVGDTAGFAAATYMRGVKFVQIPTTLLSMVDSSVGGKVGVDLPQGKNLVGAFKQPERVLIDTDVLKTLPDSEWRNGMAEVIKHAFLADPMLLNPSLHTFGRAAELVKRAVQVKIDVVQRDPFEKGERAHLNLGHTFGHAIEQVSNYRWSHGEGVGVGLMLAAKLSHRLSLCDSALVEQVEALLAKVGLPTRIGSLDPEAIYAAMSTDKKWQGGKSRFVLLKGIGQPTIVEDVPRDIVLDVLRSIGK